VHKDWRREIGDWRREIGDWRLEIGEWRREIGEWRRFSNLEYGTMEPWNYGTT